MTILGQSRFQLLQALRQYRYLLPQGGIFGFQLGIALFNRHVRMLHYSAPLPELAQREFEVDMIDETISNLESFKGHLIETGRGCVGCWKKLNLDLEVLHAILQLASLLEVLVSGMKADLQP